MARTAAPPNQERRPRRTDGRGERRTVAETVGREGRVLLSDGGSDIVGDQFCIWLNDAKPPFDVKASLRMDGLDAMIGVITTSIGNLIKLINKYYLGFMTSYSSWRPNIGPVEMSNPVRPPSTILWALATTLALL